MYLIGLVGMLVLMDLAWAMWYHRKLFPVRIVAWGLGLQFLFALIVLRNARFRLAPSLRGPASVLLVGLGLAWLVTHGVHGRELFAAFRERSVIISTDALCGLASLSSIGIQVGGIQAISPARKADLARLGLKAMLAWAIASCLSAAIAGMLL